MIKERSIVTIILLSIFTCGIYGIFWTISVTDEVNSVHPDKKGLPSGGAVILFSILTCGIYSYYWYYKQTVRIEEIGKQLNIAVGDNSVINVVLAIFGFSIVSMAIMQNELNKIANIMPLSGNNNNYNNYYNNNQGNQSYYNNQYNNDQNNNGFNGQ